MSVPVQLLERRGAAAVFLWVVVPLAVVLAVAAVVATIRLQLAPPHQYPPGRLMPLDPEEEAEMAGRAAARADELPPPQESEPPRTLAPSETTGVIRSAPIPEPPPPPAKADAQAQTSPTPKKTRPARPKRTTGRSVGSPRKGMSTLRIRCPSPVDVHVQGFGRFPGVLTLNRTITPGAYTVTFRRKGQSVGRVAINLVADRTLDLKCP